MRTAALIGGAGALGSLARYGLDGAVSRRFPGAFPLGTFVVNVVGALLLGLLFTVFVERMTVGPALRSAVTIGFLGAFTTFSTFTLETLRLVEDGAWGLAAANVIASVVLGLAAAYGGIALGRAL